jgi:hypothetical protein
LPTARGYWVTSEKTLIDKAGLRRVDDILTALSADQEHLLNVLDRAGALFSARN